MYNKIFGILILFIICNKPKVYNTQKFHCQLSKNIHAGTWFKHNLLEHITCLSIWNFQFRDLPECIHLFPAQMKKKKKKNFNRGENKKKTLITRELKYWTQYNLLKVESRLFRPRSSWCLHFMLHLCITCFKECRSRMQITKTCFFLFFHSF